MKTVKIDQKLIKTIEKMLKWSKNVKITKKTEKFWLKMRENQNYEKHGNPTFISGSQRSP